VVDGVRFIFCGSWFFVGGMLVGKTVAVICFASLVLRFRGVFHRLFVVTTMVVSDEQFLYPAKTQVLPWGLCF
jgi:hypothetical protein